MFGSSKNREQEIVERDKKYIKFLNDLQYFNTSIKTSDNLKELLNFLLNAILFVFNCDRAFLRYPLEVKADYFEVPMEATKPEYPGVFSIGKRLPMRPEVLKITRHLLDSNGPIAFGPGKAFDFPEGETWDQFNIKSMMTVAIHPKIGPPWEFGIHQCSHLRVWNDYEKELFTEISYRITDSLSNWLYFQKLKESEEKFRHLFENARDGILLVNIKTKQFYTGNKRICEKLGYSLEELENLNVIDIHPKDKLPYILEQFEKQTNHVIDLAVDIPVKRKDGSIFYADINASTIDIGGITYLMGIFRDVTDRKTSEQKLKESEQLYQDLYEEAPNAYFSIGPDKTILMCNKAAVRLLGYSEKELVNKTVFDLYADNENGLVEARQLFKQFLKGETIQDKELQMKKKNGELVWISLTVNPILDQEGNIIQSRSMVVDITERKKAEQKLKESEEKFRTLAENIPGVIYLCKNDERWTMLYLNDEAEQLTGYPKEEFLEDRISFVDLYHPKYNDMIFSKVEKAIDKKKPFHLFYEIKHKNGEWRWIEEVGIGVYKDNQLLMLEGFLVDITDRKRAEQKLKDSEERYRELIENLNECVAVYDAVENGSDFMFKDYNKAAEKADQITRDELLGKTICEMFPGVHEFGLLDVFKRVWKTGVPEHHPITLYKDQRIQGWRENYVYKLPSGEIVAVYQDMTEKMKLDQQLKESEMRYRQLFESSPHFIFLLDLDWNMIDCNFAVENILGYSKEFLIGKNIIDTPLLDYTDINLLRERTQKIIKGGIVEPIELRIPRIDGKLIWVSSTSSLVKIGEKKSIQIQGRDISKRRETEQKLKESEHLYQDLYEDAPNTYLSIGVDETIRLCNKAAIKLLGYSKEELLKKKVFDLYADTENGLVKARLLFNRFLKGDIIQDEELQMKKKNGELVWISLTVNPILDQEGNIIQSRSMIVDITDRKKAEQKLKNSEQKFRHLFEDSPLMITLLNKEGKIVDFNDKVVSYTGYDKQELLDKDYRELTEIFLPNHLKDLSDKYREIWKNGSIEPFEAQYRNKDNSVRWIKVWASLVKIESEPLIQLNIENIEQIKQAENLIKQELKKLKELDKIRQDLINRISHELKTPLTSIFGVSQAFMEIPKDELNVDILDYLEILNKGSLRLKALINNLLDASRLSSKKIGLKIQEENLGKLIRECIDEIKYLLSSRSHKINIDLPKELFFKVDKVRISQAIINLLSNAIKNTPVNGAIFIYINEMEKYIDIRIKDTGVGLTKKEKGQLFQKFGKIERYGQNLDVDIEGVGLGLYISKEIVELHGGEILVESKGRNKGATFTIRLYKSN